MVLRKRQVVDVWCNLFLWSFLYRFQPSASFVLPYPRELLTKVQRFVRNDVEEPDDELLVVVARNHHRQLSRASLLALGVASIPTISRASSNAREESISGFVAGAFLTLTKTIVKYPLDTATVRLQMPKTNYTIRDPSRLFQGAFDGVLAPLLANIPAGAVFFAVKDLAKSSLSDFELPRWLRTCIAVAIAQGPYWLVRNPSEVVKTRQQARLEGYNGVSALQAYQYLLEQASLNSTGRVLEAFYTGYWENIWYAYPADVIKFVCYEQITGGRTTQPTPAEGAVAGAVATAVAQFLTTPLDVVRNRVMAGQQEKPVQYMESLITLARIEGYNGLFAGATPRVGKAFLSGAIQFATYEETKQEMAKVFNRMHQDTSKH